MCAVQGQPTESVNVRSSNAKSTPAPLKEGGYSMDVSTFAQLFSNLGIPVACLCVTFYLWYTETQNHKEEMNKMTDAVNNNTLILQRLLDKLGEDEKA
jgi:hypothetical protein